jgi:hypothetical protein
MLGYDRVEYGTYNGDDDDDDDDDVVKIENCSVFVFRIITKVSSKESESENEKCRHLLFFG